MTARPVAALTADNLTLDVPQVGDTYTMPRSLAVTGTISATGKYVSLSNGNIDIEPNGTGNVLLGNFTLDADATIGAGQDNFVLTYDNATGLWSPEAAAGGGWANMSEAVWAGGTQSEVADGATAVGFDFSTDNVYSTAGANLARFGNTTTPVLDFSFQGGIDHANSGATTAAHSQSLNLNWSAITTQTSSGQYSCVIGRNNTASGDSAIALGKGNSASAEAVAIGESNTASGSNGSVAIGGFCTANAESSYAFGNSCSTNAFRFAVALGVYAKSPHKASLTFASGRFAAQGDAQYTTTVARAETTDATQTQLYIENTAANYMTIPADTTWAFSALIAARSDEADGNNAAIYKIEGGLKRDEANNTALVGTPTVTVIAEDTDAIPWSVDAVADDTNEALAIRVTGEAATNIRWVAKVDISQVTFA